jgi:hypothetical protein
MTSSTYLLCYLLLLQRKLFQHSAPQGRWSSAKPVMVLAFDERLEM